MHDMWFHFLHRNFYIKLSRIFYRKYVTLNTIFYIKSVNLSYMFKNYFFKKF